MAMENEQVNIHRAQMFDAIRDFFVELTSLATIAKGAIEAQLEKEKRGAAERR